MNVEVLGDDIAYGMDFAPYTTMMGAEATAAAAAAPSFWSKAGTGFVNMGKTLGTGISNILKTDTNGTTVGSQLLQIGLNKLTPTQKAQLEQAQINQPAPQSFFEQHQTELIIAGAVAVGLTVILMTRNRSSRSRR